MEKHELGSVLHTCLGRVSLFVGSLLRNVVQHALINGIISLLAGPILSRTLAMLPFVVGMMREVKNAGIYN